MTGFVETHRSFINTWECDENAHMNVQFYLHRFDEAARVYRMHCGAASAGYRLPVTRHVRYHKELVAGDCTRTRSATITEGPMTGYDIHLLEDPVSGVLYATAIDAPAGNTGFETGASELTKALPRSFEAQPAAPKSESEILELNGFLASQTVVQPFECDSDGRIVERAIVSRFTDAAPHVWNQAGIGTKWLASQNFGRVAVEMKITHHAVPCCGALLMMYSAAWIDSGKIIHLRHEIVDASTRKPCVTGDVAALVMDLATRKSVAIPNEIQKL